MATLGQRLKSLREEKRITQKQIGDLLKVSESSVGKYESDQRTPTPDAITKLADYFDVTADYLLGRTNYRTPAYVEALHIDGDPTQELPPEALRSIEEFKELMRIKYKPGYKGKPTE